MKLVQVTSLLLALGLPLHAGAATTPAAPPTPATKLMSDLEGVYRAQSQQTIKVSGKAAEKYVAEDVIEIVRHDERHVYVHARLPSGTGHRCEVKGIAGFEGGAFVYRDPQAPLSGAVCTLKLSLKAGNLLVSDRAQPKGPSTCSAQCGARSSMMDYAIATSKRVPLPPKQMSKFKASKDYVRAVKLFQDTQR